MTPVENIAKVYAEWDRLLAINAELLEKLKGAVETLRIWHVDYGNCQGCVLELEIKKLEAAIAAAQVQP